MAVHPNAVESSEPIPGTSLAERLVADVQPIGASAAQAECVRDAVPLWFHPFALAPGIYTPGIARDHGYRLAVLDADRFAGRSVSMSARLMASTASSRRSTVRGGSSRSTTSSTSTGCVARFGVALQGGAGFRGSPG